MNPKNMPKVDVTTRPVIGPSEAGERMSVTATTSLVQLADTYASMQFRDHLINKMAERFVAENYERLVTGINFEAIEAGVLEVVKQKVAGMVRLGHEPESVMARAEQENDRVLARMSAPNKPFHFSAAFANTR
jgi:hypothetical protein